jgi:hypothetical protein
VIWNWPDARRMARDHAGAAFAARPAAISRG